MISTFDSERILTEMPHGEPSSTPEPETNHHSNPNNENKNTEGHKESVHHEGGHHHEEVIPFGTGLWWTYFSIVMGLTCFAGVCSGLTVGMLSIDKMELEMMMKNGTNEEKDCANKLLPILNQHHLLLATLLLCNAFAMESLPIFLDALVPAYLAIIISTT